MLLKTNHFDILFSEPSVTNAVFLAENIDNLYDKAKSYFPEVQDFRMPIILTPDSDRLHIEYTSAPYNRIIYFEGVSEKEDNVYEDTVLGLFYHEIYLAISQSVRSPFNQFLSDVVLGDKYQPLSLIYLPFSFVEGRAFLSEEENLLSDEDNSYYLGHFNDPAFLEILSIAKYYGKFPNYLQASTSRDIYPFRILNEAAGSAFTAYLMHTYGIEKYVEFWTLCGNVNFNLTKGLFTKVYGISLSKLWKDFESSIPLPSNIEEMKELDEKAVKLYPYENESLFQNILVTDYGLVWYDGIRHEVDIYDWNNPLNIRQLLFLASDIKKLSLSPDGRYMVVSFYGIKSDSQFRNDRTWIYDLQKRKKLDFSFNLREGEIVTLPNKKMGMAGIYVKDKVPTLQVYELNYEGEECTLYYEKTFPLFYYPSNITYGGEGKVNYIVTKNNIDYLCSLNLETKEEEYWQAKYRGEYINIDNIRVMPSTKRKLNENDHYYYLFEYYPKDEPSFKRMGIIKLNKDYTPENIYYQNKDIAGGVNYPYIFENVLFYVSNRFDHSDILALPLTSLSFEKGEIVKKEQDNFLSMRTDTVAVDVKEEIKTVTLSKENVSLPLINDWESKEENISDNIATEDKETNNISDIEEKKENKIERKEASFIDKETIKSGDVIYNVEKYNPFKYLFHYSVSPFFAIKDLTKTTEQKLFPSLGATITTQDDPFMNNKIMISGSGAYAPLDLEKVFNPSLDDLNETKQRHVDDKKNISAAISIENTSTPIDIRSGILFKANLDGEYSFNSNINTLWPISLGMDFNYINLTFNASYIASTDYYDINLSDKYPSLSKWPSFNDAYETSQLSLGFEYSNIHQCGISPYETRGISIGASFDTFWDLYELRLLRENVKKTESEQSEKLTPAQKKKLYTDSQFDLSLLNIGFYTHIKIPRLTPFSMYEGLVLSLPTDFYFEMLQKNGTALHLRTETLLLGYEAQNGIPPIYLFFSRIGLKGGYDFQLRYDTHKVPLPDIRKKNNLWNVFSNAYIRDSVFLIFDMNFCAGIGRMSEYHVNLALKAEYYLRSQSFSFRVKFTISL